LYLRRFGTLHVALAPIFISTQILKGQKRPSAEPLISPVFYNALWLASYRKKIEGTEVDIKRHSLS
jgi:hypothetical protein